MHRLTLNDSGSWRLNQSRFSRSEIPLAVNRHTEWIHHSSKHGVTNGNGSNLACRSDGASFLNSKALAHQHNADVVIFEVEGNPFGAVFELNQLTSHHLLKAIYTGNTVTNLQDGADVADRYGLVIVLDLLLENGADLVGSDGNHGGKTQGRVVSGRAR